MCSIYGTVGIADQKFYDEQHQQAIKRGKDPVFVDVGKGRLFHYRTPTNNSTDKYPVELDGYKIAMNGIVSQSKYQDLVKKYGDINYTVDTAYLLREIADYRYTINGMPMLENFDAVDTLDYVFALWIITPKSVILANKDYPLHIKVVNGNVYFSSFQFEGSQPVGNKAIQIDNDMNVKELYKYKNLIYGE